MACIDRFAVCLDESPRLQPKRSFLTSGKLREEFQIDRFRPVCHGELNRFLVARYRAASPCFFCDSRSASLQPQVFLWMISRSLREVSENTLPEWPQKLKESVRRLVIQLVISFFHSFREQEGKCGRKEARSISSLFIALRRETPGAQSSRSKFAIVTIREWKKNSTATGGCFIPSRSRMELRIGSGSLWFRPDR